MGVLEELPDDSGACSNCGKVALTKCTGCKQVINPMCSEDVLKINVRNVKGAQATMIFYPVQATKIFLTILVRPDIPHFVFLTYEPCTLTNCNRMRLQC
jgi:hypothetical protein